MAAVAIAGLAVVVAPRVSHAGTIRYVNHADATCQGQSPCYPTIQAAAATAHSGDTVRIQAGTYTEQVHIQEKNHSATATEADRIVLEADPAAPPGSVVVSGRTSQCTNGEAIRLAQSKFVTIRGLTLTGAGGPAISLLGGNNQNQAIHIERNRIFNNGSPECNGGITIAQGNPDTLILNNLIYANGRNGIATIDADGGPHYIIGNTIHANQWNGLRITRSHVAFLVNNAITQNGTAASSTGGRFGVSREASTSPQPAGIHLLNNLICGNRLGEIDGPALDATDAGNLTPTGAEGPGVTASPGCELPATVYANVNGPDTQPNTADDDFTLKAASPAIDRGMDPRTLGLTPAFNPLLEADFAATATRPRDGEGDGTAAFDLGALEFVPAGGGPTVTGLSPAEGAHGQTVALTVTGTGLARATALTFLKDGTPDAAIAASGLSANADGTQLTASVAIGAAATLGQRVVTVTTPAGTSPATATAANTFTVLGQITLVPDFLSLIEGQQGGLTVQLSAPAPPSGLTVNLSSAAPGIASVPASVAIAAGATSAPTTVTAVLEGTTNITGSASGFASGMSVITVRAPIPTLAGFNPTSGRVGTTVVLTGTGFRLTPSANSVSFTGGTSRVPAAVSAATATSLTVTVPAAAVTGPLQVTTSGGTATSAGSFVVIPTEDFQLSALPNTVNVAAAGQGAFNVSLTGAGGYTGLTTLAVTGVPTGATATFAAPSLTGGQTTLLKVVTNGTTAAGPYLLTVTASGPVNGVQTTRQASITLQVQPAGQTSLTGQVLDEDAKPVKGALIRLGGLQATTDDAGNFFLANPPVGADQLLFIDGGPASSPGKSFPIIPYKVTIVAGQANTLGFTPHLHFQKTTGLVDISNSSAQRVVTQPDIPGFQMTIPAGVTITGWDGQPNTQLSVRRIPLDRSPTPPLPPGLVAVSAYMDYFGKPGGGTPSQPVPITFPNDMGLPPGTQVELWFYDEAPDGSRPNQWAQYGTGTVSADGSQVLPDTDPKTGKPFGQPRFCCGEVRYALREAARDALNSLRGGQAEAAQPVQGGEPVNLSTGTFALQKTDLVLPGRLPLVFTRTYRTNGPPLGPFGAGTSHSVYIYLLVEGNLRTLVLPTGARLAFPQQADGSFRNVTDPPVRGAVLTAAAPGHVLRFKDGTTWAFGQPFAGSTVAFLVRQTDRNGNTLTLTYTVSQDNLIGQLVAITEPSGRQLTLTYEGDNSPRITSLTDPMGRTVTYTYGPGGLTSVTDPAGGVTRYSYDAQGRMTSITDPRGITFITNEYDANGRVVKQTQADGGVWQFAYTVVAGTVTQTVVTDPRGNPTTSRFNGQGYLLAQTDALGQTTTFTRDPAGNLLRATTDPLGRTTRFTYDAAGNVTSITDPAANVRTFTYDPTFNKVTSVTDPLGNVTAFQYDPTTGNLLKITDPRGAVTQIAYNASGQPIATTDPLGNITQFAYTDQGALTRIVDPLGNTTTRVYDPAGRLVSAIDARGKATTFEYDVLNRLLSLIDALGGTTALSYDPNGNLLAITDARGNSITHAYDTMDRLIQRTDQVGGVDAFSYDSNGNLVSSSDRNGQVASFIYDFLNRRVRSQFADGAVVQFTYDSVGRLIQADDTADPHRPVVREYDSLDRLLTETTAMGAVTYRYDLLGRRIQMTVSGQGAITYSYDSDSRLTAITQAPLNPMTFDYDALGRRTVLSLPNGVSIEYQYDATSRVTALIYRNAGGTLGDLRYTYDPAGNRTEVGGSWARTLLPGSIGSSSYDAGNRQLTFGGKTMTYDGNGNLTTVSEGGTSTTYTWDVRNRLAGLAGPGITARFSYDSAGRRASTVINGVTRTYQYAAMDIARENVEGADAIYLMGPGVDDPLARTSPGISENYLLDALGTVVALTDSSGLVQTIYTYSPFGVVSIQGLATASPLGFTAREHDETGLYYYRARYYHPGLGRFISEDPIGLRGRDPNVYAYVGNNPTRMADPFGLLSTPEHVRITRRAFLEYNFTDAEIKVAAWTHWWVDWSYENLPLLSGEQHCMPGTEAACFKYIRENFNRAVELTAAGCRTDAIQSLTRALHASQDWPMHAGNNPPGTWWQHFPLFGSAPDNPAWHRDAYERALNYTNTMLRDFMKEVGKARGQKPGVACPPDPPIMLGP